MNKPKTQENANTMYKTTLDKSSRKHKCPSCGQKRMVKYIFNDTGEYIADNVGRCDREINCSYHYPPKDYYKDNPSPNIKQHTHE